ncbi:MULTISPECIES: hypothetical protein [unclassified Leptolyngbya]|uniref:hypothetical protein n=1 Tax=unclassified Leptolyngbya TaxID=2650499 RepID=UPI003D31F61F
MQIKIAPEFAQFIQRMSHHNGLDPERYATNLLEKGIRRELAQTFTEDSVSRFMHHLTTTKTLSFTLLIQRQDLS